MLRQDARTSQADFLSSVLPVQDFDFGTTSHSSTSTPTSTFLQRLSPPMTPNAHAIDDAIVASGLSSGRAEGRETTAGVAVSSTDGGGGGGFAAGSSFSDKQAAARWASMRRLHEQSLGLGSAADHQLTRALQLCRDLRGLKVRKSTPVKLDLVAGGCRL